MMLPLLLTLWSWTACPDPGPLTFRVEYVRRSDLSAPWLPTFVQEGPETSAEVPCEPASGECCIAIVTSVDEAGNEDEGDDCGD